MSAITLTDVPLITKWTKLKTCSGFISDHSFADYLLTCEEHRLTTDCTQFVSKDPLVEANSDSYNNDKNVLPLSNVVGDSVVADLIDDDFAKAVSNHNAPVIKLFKCELCGVKLKTKRYLQKHYKRQHVDFYLSKKSIERQLATDKLENTFTEDFSCKLCNKRLRNQDGCRVHFLLMHCHDTPYECELCDEKFKINNYLQKHYREKHSKFLGLHGKPKKKPRTQTNYKPETKNIVCKLCGKTLGSRRNYLNHILLKHSNETPYECKHCGEKFKLKKYLHKHHHKDHTGMPLTREEEIYDVSKIPCLVCGKRLTDKRGYEMHMQLAHSDATPYECEVCHEKFKISKYLQKHYAERHPGKKEIKLHTMIEDDAKMSIPEDFICTLCSKKLCDKRGYKMHMRVTHSANTPHECDVCGEKYKINRYLRIHYNKNHPDYIVHLKEKQKRDRLNRNKENETDFTHQCKICSRRFKSLKSLGFHLSKVCDKAKYAVPDDLVCTQCGKKLSDKNGYRSHFITAHTDATPFSCDVCGKKFKLEFYLKNHMLKHTGERNYICNTCGKAFYTKNSMMTHEKVVHSEQKFVCPECNKVYHSASGLKNHTRLHTGQTFVCDICGKGFLRLRALSEHKLVAHFGQKKSFKCQLCSSAFSHSSALASHMKQKHSDHTPFEKKHACQYCDKKFYTQWNLKEHHHVHTGDKPYKCEICSKLFHTYVAKRNHTHHCRPDPQAMSDQNQPGDVRLQLQIDNRLQQDNVTRGQDIVCESAVRTHSNMSLQSLAPVQHMHMEQGGSVDPDQEARIREHHQGMEMRMHESANNERVISGEERLHEAVDDRRMHVEQLRQPYLDHQGQHESHHNHQLLQPGRDNMHLIRGQYNVSSMLKHNTDFSGFFKY